MIDTIDVGNPDADKESSEASHEYQLEGSNVTVSRIFRVSDEATLEEDARTFTIAEEFRVRARQGERLILAKRYDAAIGQSLRVFIDGQEIGVWDLPKKDFFFGEEFFEIPAEFVAANQVKVRLVFVPDQPGAVADSFFYWVLAYKSGT